LSSLVTGACTKDASHEQAMRLERDRAELVGVVNADLAAERALAEVGEAEKNQQDDDAAALIDAKVVPATDTAIAQAKGARLETEWGRARRDEMLSAISDRRAELPVYAAALRAHDFEAQLSSVQRQIAVEKRAMQAAAAIQARPDASAP
jgi:hypothetical protein